MTATFMDRLIAGTAKPSDIDDEIEIWHSGAHGADLEAFLGMTKDEYSLFILDPDSLEMIKNRRLSEGEDICLGDIHWSSIKFDPNQNILSQEVLSRITRGTTICLDSASGFQKAIFDLSKAPE